MRSIGRYALFAPIATGGMSRVYLGRLKGPLGFRRTVAIKRMLEGVSDQPQARQMLADEARISSRVSHANVVQTLDAVEHDAELFLVLEYVEGESLDQLLKKGRPPPRIATAVVAGALRGLHAAHEARGEDGRPLDLVHRDLSPHNILVDVNGVPRVVDFGVARARGRLNATQDGQLKGKLAYLAPEQVHGDTSRRSDLFTAGAVLWECLAGRPLFCGAAEGDLLAKVLLCKVPRLDSAGAPLQAVLSRALDRDPERRFATAAEMADALEACGAATPAEVATWVTSVAAERLAERARLVAELEQTEDAPEGGGAPKPASGLRWAIAGAALALTVAFGAWGTLRQAPELAGAGTAAALVRPAALPAPTLPVPPAATPVNVVAVTGTSAPALNEVRPPARKHAHALVARKSQRREGPPAPKCDPPFVIDADGVKRFKVECLR
jgi:serine/threonine-protein kinase